MEGIHGAQIVASRQGQRLLHQGVLYRNPVIDPGAEGFHEAHFVMPLIEQGFAENFQAQEGAGDEDARASSRTARAAATPASLPRKAVIRRLAST